MSAVPDRRTLESMRRVDLQRLCKDHGLRANLKSESLIELLLETSKPSTSSLPRPAPSRPSFLRVTSKSSTGPRPRDRSGGSLIIHGTDDEEPAASAPRSSGSATVPKPHPPPLPRVVRKAKESQHKLGVGRPTIVKGSGPGPSFRAGSIAKPKRGKAPSTSLKPNEEAIQEVDEGTERTPPLPPESHAGPSSAVPGGHLPAISSHTQGDPHDQANLVDGVRSAITEMLLPMRDQIQSLHTNFDEISRSATEAATLSTQVAALSVEVASLRAQLSRSVQLEAEVKILRDHITILQEMGSFSSSSHTRTDPARTSAGKTALADVRVESVGSQTGREEPETTAILGKRQRSPNESLLAVNNRPPEGEINLPEPSKKRARLETRFAPSRSIGGTALPSPRPTFTVYDGPESSHGSPSEIEPQLYTTSNSLAYSDSPQRKEDLGILGESISPGGRDKAFNFTYPGSMLPPVTSTPLASPGTDSISIKCQVPHPEPPTSPTPGHPDPNPLNKGERGDHIRAFGSPTLTSARPRIGRPSSAPPPHGASSLQQTAQFPQWISPATTMGAPTPLPPSATNTRNGQAMLGIGRPRSSEVGMVVLPVPAAPETPAPPMKRTMYGTELDADSRFGDFGVDGVAVGFWSGAPQHF